MNKQEAKADNGKAKLSLVPREILWDIAAIREYGNNKYPEGGPDNWKTVEIERYRDALYRHFLLYLDDPHGVDEESGYPHLWHVACNVAFLCELEKSNLVLCADKNDICDKCMQYEIGYEEGRFDTLQKMDNILKGGNKNGES